MQTAIIGIINLSIVVGSPNIQHITIRPSEQVSCRRGVASERGNVYYLLLSTKELTGAQVCHQKKLTSLSSKLVMTRPTPPPEHEPWSLNVICLVPSRVDMALSILSCEQVESGSSKGKSRKQRYHTTTAKHRVLE